MIAVLVVCCFPLLQETLGAMLITERQDRNVFYKQSKQRFIYKL